MKEGGFWSQGVTEFFDIRVSQTPSQVDLTIRKEGGTVSYYHYLD